MTDFKDTDQPQKPLKHKRQTAVAIKERKSSAEAPTITASGYGTMAEKILALAFENDVKVREDSALAEMLAKLDEDSPIPSEAFMAVAEILSYVYRADGQPNPFEDVPNDDIKDDVNDNTHN